MDLINILLFICIIIKKNNTYKVVHIIFKNQELYRTKLIVDHLMGNHHANFAIRCEDERKLVFFFVDKRIWMIGLRDNYPNPLTYT